MLDSVTKVVKRVLPWHEMRGRTVKRILHWLTLGIALGAVVILLWKIPQWQLAVWKTEIDYTKGIAPKDFIKLESDLRKSWAQILVGGALLVGLYLLWRTYRLNREGQITDRFNKAIEHLDYTNALEVRLGGIYALERIAKESERNYWPIMEVLSAYVREHAKWKDGEMPEPQEGSLGGQGLTIPKTDQTKPAADIQAVLIVLQRRDRWYERRERNPLDLSFTNLRGVYLSQAHLRGVILKETHLEGADLQGAHLEGADLQGAHLERAVLTGAHLEGADLKGAHLERADLKGAHLEGADLQGAHLERAVLTGAHLEGADLKGAHLERAVLGEAHLDGAHLYGAHLEGGYLVNVHLERAVLTGAHLEGVYLSGAHLIGAYLYGAHLEEADLSPDEVRSAQHWNLAFYHTEFLQGLGLPPDHNEKLAEKMKTLRLQ